VLIYLDTMIVQHCVDYEDFVFAKITGHTGDCPVTEPRLRRELRALQQLMFFDQLGDWTYACTPGLLNELHAGKPTHEQQRAYRLLSRAWEDSGWSDAFPLQADALARIESSLEKLNLRDSADQRHLAEAVVLNASWFLTNDREIINKCKGQNLPLRVARPSECLDEISVGLLLR
jgi:hypothetical protein